MSRHKRKMHGKHVHVNYYEKFSKVEQTTRDLERFERERMEKAGGYSDSIDIGSFSEMWHSRPKRKHRRHGYRPGDDGSGY